jgi:hypothetical protein
MTEGKFGIEIIIMLSNMGNTPSDIISLFATSIDELMGIYDATVNTPFS